MRVLFIDNFDPFTYNLVEEFEKKGCEVLVYRSDTDIRIIENEIKKFKPRLIVIGSGPSLQHAQPSIEIIGKYYTKIPIFGVGLGNGCIIEAFEGRIGKAPETFCGKQSKIACDGKTIYKKVGKTFKAGAYCQLVGIEIPYCLEVSARNEANAVMGVRHKEHFIEGVQFNPASILTPLGSIIIDGLLEELSSNR
jgi:anthranilate synthase/aminodeoxychorismate synthase-like glutamine amidotransferase